METHVEAALPEGRGTVPRRRVSWRVRLTILLATGLVCAGIGELGLRVALGSRLVPFYEEDPACLYRMIPDNDKAVARPPGDTRPPLMARINRDGFRGPELRPDGEARRVIVYGDSCTVALFADLESTYPVRLGAELERRLPGRPFEVLNAGVAGYGPDQELLRMEREIGRYRPELVVVALFAANDMGDLLRNRLFRLDAEGRLERGQPELDGPIASEFRNARSWAIRRVFDKALKLIDRAQGGAGSPTGEGPVETNLRARLAEYDEYVRGERIVRNIFQDGYDADASCHPDGESARLKAALLAAVLGRMAEVCGEAKVPLLVLIVPTPVDLCHRTKDFAVMRVDPARFPKYDPRALTNAMASAAAGRGIPCVDLAAPFDAAGPASMYYPDDDHWNEAGQAYAAKVTAEFLIDRGLLR